MRGIMRQVGKHVKRLYKSICMTQFEKWGIFLFVVSVLVGGIMGCASMGDSADSPPIATVIELVVSADAVVEFVRAVQDVWTLWR